jgi:hypothetical protein
MEILNRDQRIRHWWPALPLLALAGLAGMAGAGDGLPHWLTVSTADQLRGDVAFLASEELDGRAVLTPGSRSAAAFVASRFQALGLTPAGEGDRDWYQRVPLIRTPVRSGSCTVTLVDGDTPPLELAWGVDFRCRPVAAGGMEIPGKEVVFAGYGIHAPDLGHDDYAGIEAAGRVLVVLAGAPAADGEGGAERGLSSRHHSSVTAKRDAARSRGAAALLVLPLPGGGPGEARRHPDFWPDVLRRAEEEPEDAACPAILLEEEAAGRLVTLAGIRLVPGGGAPRPLPGVRIACTLRMGEAEAVTTRNVLALIPGRDELHFREFVIVSAHYDHLGSRGGSRVFPGADDNASGVAAMIGAARALAALPPNRRPARSVLFIAWAGEERGFLGSEHFGAHPTVPRGQIKTLINLDMVGRNNGGEDAHVNTALAIYSAQAPGLEAMLDAAAGSTGLDLRLRPQLRMSQLSDNKIFHRLGIPVVHFFTGLHGDYNRPGDMADKINYDKLLRISQTAAGLAFELADADSPPVFDDTIEKVRTRNDAF